MTTEELRNLLVEKQQRMNELKGIMADSDNHAKKAKKLELDFAEAYPEDKVAYVAANEEYHRLEFDCEEIEEEIRRREEEELRNDDDDDDD